MSDYDVLIARKVAFVLCGGDLTQTQKSVRAVFIRYRTRRVFRIIKKSKNFR